MADVKTVIANAIKDADKSYFFEDYTKQAAAVIRMLHSAGLAIVPHEPDLKMTQAGVNAVIIGKTKPHELSGQIYRAMVKSYAGIK